MPDPSGPESDASHHEAGNMAAVDLPGLRSALPLHARGGPCMLRGLGATPATKRTGEKLVGLRSHQTFKNWMERYNIVDL